MGIRVSCPNGHVLNVKSYLAGKRGKCPTCGATFVVPNQEADEELDPNAPKTAFDQIDIDQLTRETREAARLVPLQPRGALDLEDSVSLATVDSPTTQLAPENQPPTEITSDPAAVWYVRRASGDQYGPAQAMMFWQWVQEGRVPEDAHVWKQGWPEWKSAKQWLAKKDPAPQKSPQLSLPQNRSAPGSSTAPSAASSGARINVSSASGLSGVQSLPAAASPVAMTAARQVRRRKGSDMTAAIIVVLLLMFLASLTGAIIVIYQAK
jgi:hypothetical protein